MFDWILQSIESSGYAGIFFLMILENLFPPIPSEVILPLAGFVAARGELHIAGVVLVATAGAVGGCMPWYVLGRVFRTERLKRLSARYGRLLTLSPSDVDRAQAWFARHGQKAVLFGRLIPAVRTLISVPAGSTGMPFSAFVLYSFVGSALWTAMLAALGYILQSQYEKVARSVGVASDVIVMLIIAIYLYRVVPFRNKMER
mgnify:CR=1 FL=1